jgi:hypothetical protein
LRGVPDELAKARLGGLFHVGLKGIPVRNPVERTRELSTMSIFPV